jgi:hypothetical protein
MSAIPTREGTHPLIFFIFQFNEKASFSDVFNFILLRLKKGFDKIQKQPFVQ